MTARALRYLPGEREAIAQVVAHGHQYGFGNLISELKNAWSAKLQATQEMPARTADAMAGHSCAWCGVDSRTGKQAHS